MDSILIASTPQRDIVDYGHSRVHSQSLLTWCGRPNLWNGLHDSTYLKLPFIRFPKPQEPTMMEPA
jgi:hypothetical protein